MYRRRCHACGLALAALLLSGCPSAGHGPGGRGPGGPPRLPELGFGTLDANEDDALDPAEFQRFADALFANLDADHDGRLSRAEYRSLRERGRPRRGGWGERAPGGSGPSSQGGGW